MPTALQLDMAVEQLDHLWVRAWDRPKGPCLKTRRVMISNTFKWVPTEDIQPKTHVSFPAPSSCTLVCVCVCLQGLSCSVNLYGTTMRAVAIRRQKSSSDVSRVRPGERPNNLLCDMHALPRDLLTDGFLAPFRLTHHRERKRSCPSRRVASCRRLMSTQPKSRSHA